MFERRLKWFVIGMLMLTLVIIARLFEIQVIKADEYIAIADEMLTRPVSYLRAPRGGINDRSGRPLVSDEPTADACAHYAVLEAFAEREMTPAAEQYLYSLARRRRELGESSRSVPLAEAVARLRDSLDESWERLAQLTGVPLEELRQRASSIVRRVERIREARARRAAGGDPTVREEGFLHPLVENLDHEIALEIGLQMEPYPWIRAAPSVHRISHQADPFVHVIGRLGAADADAIEADPLRDDEFRGLLPGDQRGVSGVERIAETTLRGVRGHILEDFDHTVLERVEPVQGRDVRLTIDAEIQREVYRLLGQAVEESDHPSGGAAVVLDVDTRDVLALVSYPVYGYEKFSADYPALQDDVRRLPLRFRAVSEQYPPGSTGKVAGMYGALQDGLVTPATTFNCNGHYLANRDDIFRCWIYNQYRSVHGPQSAVEAIKNSCNIYFYNIGERLGAARLCEYFDLFGLGHGQGTGLIEEAPGIVPSAAWLRQSQGREFQPSDAWNFVIGQGEVTATPLQCANVAAVVASGRWAPVTLVRDEFGTPLRGDVTPEPERHFRDDLLRVIRDGMWQVVNAPGGTAAVAKLDHPNHVLCGKTGSAQAMPRPLNYRYTLEWPDGRRETVIAGDAREEALAGFPDPKPAIVGRHTNDRFPPWRPDEKLPSHAWFIGFTQLKSVKPGDPPRGKVYAISVIIEYGGSGGRTAGPVAKQIAEALLASEREWG